MGRYLILDGNTVVNIAEADADFAASQGWVQDDEAGIGWVREGETFVPPVAPELAPVFPTLTRRQLRLGLLSIGVTAEDVEAEIAAFADPTERAAALIEWEDASSYERDHPLIAEVAAAMDLPPAQVDDLWLWAEGI